MGNSIIYVSCCSNGFYSLNKLLDAGIRIDYVVTITSEQAKKANVSGFTDFSKFCYKCGIPIYYLKRYDWKDPKDLRWIKEKKPDLMIVNGWNRLIPEDVFNACRLKGLGVHAGHPPRGRGRAPVSWSLILGMRDLDVYLFVLDGNADSGPILGIKRIQITKFDNAKHLYDKVMLAVTHLLIKYVPKYINGEVELIQQNDKYAQYHPARAPQDGLINWTLQDWEIYNWIRGQSRPYPGAFTFLDGKKVIVWSAQPFDNIFAWERRIYPGEIVEILPSGIVVQTGTSPILLTEIEIDKQVYKLSKWPKEFMIGKLFY